MKSKVVLMKSIVILLIICVGINSGRNKAKDMGKIYLDNIVISRLYDLGYNETIQEIAIFGNLFNYNCNISTNKFLKTGKVE